MFAPYWASFCDPFEIKCFRSMSFFNGVLLVIKLPKCYFNFKFEMKYKSTFTVIKFYMTWILRYCLDLYKIWKFSCFLFLSSLLLEWKISFPLFPFILPMKAFNQKEMRLIYFNFTQIFISSLLLSLSIKFYII